MSAQNNLWNKFTNWLCASSESHAEDNISMECSQTVKNHQTSTGYQTAGSRQLIQGAASNFYQQPMEKDLRFGDILKGIVATNLNMKKSVFPGPNQDYHVDIHIPALSVLLTPCCTVRDQFFILTPLTSIKSSFFDNPYFLEDFTRINREMEPEQAVPPKVWQNLPDEQKIKRLHEGTQYALLDFFIYQENELLPKYQLNNKELGTIETAFHMIDFRHLYRINGEGVKNAQTLLAETKILELSIQTRTELRNKMSWFFGRSPEEDIIIE